MFYNKVLFQSFVINSKANNKRVRESALAISLRLSIIRLHFLVITCSGIKSTDMIWICESAGFLYSFINTEVWDIGVGFYPLLHSSYNHQYNKILLSAHHWFPIILNVHPHRPDQQRLLVSTLHITTQQTAVNGSSKPSLVWLYAIFLYIYGSH